MPNLKSKKAQLTLFVIIGIIIVVLAVSIYFVVTKTSLITRENEVETYFKTCVDEKVKEVVATAELQGGFLELPQFESGSDVFPFSSYFNFLALDIPYWFYISGNGIQKIQQPKIEDIERQFGDYLKISIEDCTNFEKNSKFYGINITYENISDLKVNINANNIETIVYFPLLVKSQDIDFRISEHKISTSSSFGSLYNEASKFFNEETQKAILESYALDVINNYAPVDGLEISCAPKIWSKEQIQNDLRLAFQENIQSLKVSGSDYRLRYSENKYFVIRSSVTKQINFLYLKNWLTKIEVWPNEGAFLKAEPIGNQENLGSLGFCLIPYHFVYDASFPVLVQISDGTEIFQFPLLVVIDKMSPRNLTINETSQVEFDLCKTEGQTGTVFTSYQNKPISSEISFRCLMQTCKIGETNLSENEARLTAKFPKCVNGILTAQSRGYKDAEAVVSTNEPFILSMNLVPLYNLTIELNAEQDETAMISFASESYSTSVFYPQQSSLTIPEGNYEVKVQIQKPSSIVLGSQQVEECINIPASGIPGMMGMTTEQCYNLTLPSSQLTNVPIGGGLSDFYVTDAELKDSKKIKIQAEKFDVPQTSEDVMDIYDMISISPIKIDLG